VAFLQVPVCDTKKHTDGMGQVDMSLHPQLSPSQASSPFHCPQLARDMLSASRGKLMHLRICRSRPRPPTGTANSHWT
jgi:hypothetical protein